MKTLEQLREDHPELQEVSDEELRAIRRDLYAVAKLLMDMWVQGQLSSKHIPLGLLSFRDPVEYDGEDV